MSLAHPCYRSLFSHEYGVLIAAFGLLLSLLPGLPAEAAEPNTPVVRFENPLSRVEATSQQLGGINTIVQDSYGFIWMGGENGVADRKSTRLNSSHVAISYAVFCLIKKKNILRQRR